MDQFYQFIHAVIGKAPVSDASAIIDHLLRGADEDSEGFITAEELGIVVAHEQQPDSASASAAGSIATADEGDEAPSDDFAFGDELVAKNGQQPDLSAGLSDPSPDDGDAGDTDERLLMDEDSGDLDEMDSAAAELDVLAEVPLTSRAHSE